MTGKQVASFWTKQIQPSGVALPRVGTTLYGEPEDIVLAGVNFDTSRSKESVFVRPFLQILSKPCDHVTLGYGNRLLRGRMDSWDMDDEVQRSELALRIQVECLPFVTSHRGAEGAVHLVCSYAKDRGDHHIWEAYAQILAYLGQLIDSQAAVRQALRHIEDDPRDAPWLTEMKDRCLILRKRLDEGPHPVKQLLLGWASITVQSLKVRPASGSTLAAFMSGHGQQQRQSDPVKADALRRPMEGDLD